MSFRFLHYVCALVLTGILFIVPPAANGQSNPKPKHGQPILFSDVPGTSQQITNLSEVKANGQTLRNLDDQFSRSLGAFKPLIRDNDNAFGGPIVVNVPQPVLSSKKARELLDRNKNWAFMTAADYTEQRTIEEAIGVPTPDSETKKTALDRFNEQGMRFSPGATNFNRSRFSHSQPDDDLETAFLDDSKSKTSETGMDGIREAARLSKFDTTSSSFSPMNSAWDLASVFGKSGVKDKDNYRERDFDRDKEFDSSHGIDGQKDFFQRIQAGPDYSLNPDANLGGLNPMDGLQNLTTSPNSRPALVNLPEMTAASDSSLGMQPMALGTISGTRGMSGPAAGPIAPGSQPAPLNVSAQSELPRFAMPQPVFVLPKRKF